MLFKPILPVVEYVVFYEHIKNELCENKALPELQCNGKCHLGKELAKAADTSDKLLDKPISIDTVVSFCEDINLYSNLLNATQYSTSHPIVEYTSNYSFLQLKSLFKPPIV